MYSFSIPAHRREKYSALEITEMKLDINIAPDYDICLDVDSFDRVPPRWLHPHISIQVLGIIKHFGDGPILD